MKTFKKLGKGRKKCQCGKIIAARAKQCPCGDFKKALPPEEKKPEGFNRALDTAIDFGVSHIRTVVYTPSGDCPAKLKENVPEWIRKVMEYGFGQEKVYSAKALKYWVRDFHSYGTEKYLGVCKEIDEFFGENSE